MSMKASDVKSEPKPRGSGLIPVSHAQAKPGEAEAVDERRARAVDMRIRGMRQRDIAKALGVSEATICMDLKANLQKLHCETVALTDQWREMELTRIDAILAAMEPGMSQGDSKAASVFLKAAESRRKLLGVDEDKGTPAVEAKVIIEVREVDDWGANAGVEGADAA